MTITIPDTDNYKETVYKVADLARATKRSVAFVANELIWDGFKYRELLKEQEKK